jgi:LysM repeat protein
MKEPLRIAAIAASVLVVAACGGVITPEPTSGPEALSSEESGPMPTLPMTATPPILPPAPTGTPPPTPTETVHVVLEGETLLSIAFDYDVTLAALQAANGIDNPALLSVGQELVIPPAEDVDRPISALLLPTPTPLPFGVRGVAFYETSVGGLRCLGEIVNTTDTDLANVQVRVLLYDSAGELQLTGDAFSAVELVPPGERAPFGVLFTSPPQDWANPQIAIVRGEAAGRFADSYVPIEVTGVSAGPEESQFRVTGTATNSSTDRAAGSVSVVVTTYDAQGLVTGFRQKTLELDGSLTPGSSGEFEVLFAYHGDEPADYHIAAEGRLPAE